METILQLLPSIIPIIILTTLAIIIILFLRHKHKEKIALINQGDNVSYLDIVAQMKLNNLGRGIMFIALALGVFFGYVLEGNTTIEKSICYIGTVLFFFGMGSLVFYFVLKNKS